MGSGNSEIASIFMGKVFALRTAQAIAAVTTSDSRSRARSAIGVVISSAMLIDMSQWTLTKRAKALSAGSLSLRVTVFRACEGQEAHLDFRCYSHALLRRRSRSRRADPGRWRRAVAWPACQSRRSLA